MVAEIFKPRESRTMFQAAGATLSLIHNETVHQLRSQDQNAAIALFKNILLALFMVVLFVGMYWIMGIKRSPIRGDHLLFILSGIFLYRVNTRAMGAVSGGTATSGLLKHRPLNTSILIASGALAGLYQEILTIAVILSAYYAMGNPLDIEYPLAALGTLLLVWFNGICVGMVFLAFSPWWRMGALYGRQLYMRGNMIASGKFFVANMLPASILVMFDWNPLFHLIDQMRGFLFVNYVPRNSNLEYPIKVSLILLMIGLMGEFVTRRSQSLSWGLRAN